ncbi:hypothetical protein G6F22_018546 [Rhizopus arrhizus]|nr:hypothetical protein G6F22_018546 [Rhizopus arrhizus]
MVFGGGDQNVVAGTEYHIVRGIDHRPHRGQIAAGGDVDMLSCQAGADGIAVAAFGMAGGGGTRQRLLFLLVAVQAEVMRLAGREQVDVATGGHTQRAIRADGLGSGQIDVPVCPQHHVVASQQLAAAHGLITLVDLQRAALATGIEVAAAARCCGLRPG